MANRQTDTHRQKAKSMFFVFRRSLKVEIRPNLKFENFTQKQCFLYRVREDAIKKDLKKKRKMVSLSVHRKKI